MVRHGQTWSDMGGLSCSHDDDVSACLSVCHLLERPCPLCTRVRQRAKAVKAADDRNHVHDAIPGDQIAQPAGHEEHRQVQKEDHCDGSVEDFRGSDIGPGNRQEFVLVVVSGIHLMRVGGNHEVEGVHAHDKRDTDLRWQGIAPEAGEGRQGRR